MNVVGWMVWAVAAVWAIARLASRHSYFAARILDRARGLTMLAGVVATAALPVSPFFLVPWWYGSVTLPLYVLLLARGRVGEDLRRARRQARIMEIRFEDLIHRRNACKGGLFAVGEAGEFPII